MSRSNPTTNLNPSKKFFNWAGSEGKLVYYDKQKEERVPEKLPFTFMVLDQLSTITGFSEQDKSSYWSNEVRNIKQDELTVKTSSGVKEVGKYEDLQNVRNKGAKYAKSIYIAYKENDVLAIGNIKASGAALTAWIEFSNKHDVYKCAVALTGNEAAKKGTTEYFIPVFEPVVIGEESDKEAVELDKELQKYFKDYFGYQKVDDVQATNVAPDYIPSDDELDEPIDLSDIPF